MTYKANQLRQRIMRRIYALYVLRLLSQGAPSRVVLLTLSLAGLFSSVSVGNVFRNMPNLTDMSAVGNFYIYALSHADMFVKVVVILLLVSGLLIARDVVHSFRKGLATRTLATNRI